MTEIELEVWETVQRLNRAWTSGHPEGLAEFFHPSMRALTPADRYVLEGREACVAAWTKFVHTVKVLRWSEISPRVSVLGPVAVVSYCYDLLCEAAGRALRLEGRDLFVLVRDGERWLAIADSFSEFPAPESSPASDRSSGWEIREAGVGTIETVWGRHWGLPVVTLQGTYSPADAQGLELIGEDGTSVGLVTWRREGSLAEIVTLDAMRKRQGVGSRLMLEAEDRLARLGVRRLILSTTNDNLRAIEFYLRRGYRVVRVALDSMTEVRRQKPGIPPAGQSGIPILDMWELEKTLAPRV